MVEGSKEDTESWRQFLTHLKGRGLTGVQLIVSDKCLGLVEAAAEFYPQARWQGCVVHWYRNLFSDVPTTKVKEVAAMLKAIHAQEDAASAQGKATEVVEKLKTMKLKKAAEKVGAVLLEAERRFHRIQGYREMPLLIQALGKAVDTKEDVA